jgi:hypothetical protein
MVRPFPPKVHLVKTVRNGSMLIACNKDAGSIERFTTNISECTCKACLQKVGAYVRDSGDYPGDSGSIRDNAGVN